MSSGPAAEPRAKVRSHVPAAVAAGPTACRAGLRLTCRPDPWEKGPSVGLKSHGQHRRRCPFLWVAIWQLLSGVWPPSAPCWPPDSVFLAVQWVVSAGPQPACVQLAFFQVRGTNRGITAAALVAALFKVCQTIPKLRGNSVNLNHSSFSRMKRRLGQRQSHRQGNAWNPAWPLTVVAKAWAAWRSRV